VIALGAEAAMAGYRVRYTLAATLVNAGVPARRCAAPGVRREGMETPMMALLRLSVVCQLDQISVPALSCLLGSAS
jgi:hypothetical protein